MSAKDIKTVIKFDTTKINKLITMAKYHEQQLNNNMNDIKKCILKS